jgi:hypothetical protein
MYLITLLQWVGFEQKDTMLQVNLPDPQLLIHVGY